jgi:hypothetical protein
MEHSGRPRSPPWQTPTDCEHCPSVRASPHDVEATDTAAMLLESARPFLERSNPELAALRTDAHTFNRRQMYARFEH